MAQNHLKFGDYTAPPVDQDGYQAKLATTSTSKSGRTMRGVMKNTAMFTVESYDLKWTNISVKEASLILEKVLNKNSFQFYHYNVYRSRWESGEFYAANYNTPVVDLTDEKETLNELSFQVTGINPI